MLRNQKPEVGIMDGYFYYKLRIYLKRLQNTKDFPSIL